MCHASYIKRSINMAWKEMGVMDWTAQIWMLWVVMSPLIPWHVSSQTHMKETLQGQSGEVTEYHMTLITYKNKLTLIHAQSVFQNKSPWSWPSLGFHTLGDCTASSNGKAGRSMTWKTCIFHGFQNPFWWSSEAESCHTCPVPLKLHEI